MLLKSHNDDTSIEHCLLIISENAVRYLYLMHEGRQESPEFVWLANALDYRNEGIADMHVLGLIEVGSGVSNVPGAPDDYVLEEKGKRLLIYAVSQGVMLDDLAVNTSLLQ